MQFHILNKMNNNEHRLAQILSSTSVFGIGNFSWTLRDYFDEFCDLVWNVICYVHFPTEFQRNNKKTITDIEKEHDATNIIREINIMQNIHKHENIADYIHAWKQIAFQNEVLQEAYENTEEVETRCSSTAYRDFVKYNSGNCWINCKLSNNITLNDADKQMINSINTLVENVKPLTGRVVLFHGFEKLTDYGMDEYPVFGDIINVKGFLSKSLSLDIAKSFASSCNYFCPKIIVVFYPKGSKHIFPTFRFQNTELEFLTHSNEKLKIIKIATYYEFPKFYTYFICEPVVEIAEIK